MSLRLTLYPLQYNTSVLLFFKMLYTDYKQEQINTFDTVYMHLKRHFLHMLPFLIEKMLF